MYVRLASEFRKKFESEQSNQNSALNEQTFFTVNRLSVSAFSVALQDRYWNICGQEKKEGYLTHSVDALTKVSDEGRRRLR